jgi:hypothetical protein
MHDDTRKALAEIQRKLTDELLTEPQYLALGLVAIAWGLVALSDPLQEFVDIAKDDREKGKR